MCVVERRGERFVGRICLAFFFCDKKEEMNFALRVAAAPAAAVDYYYYRKYFVTTLILCFIGLRLFSSLRKSLRAGTNIFWREKK